MEARVARLEANQTAIEKIMDSHQATLSRLIFALMGLIVVLVGKETAVSALKLGTPLMAYIQAVLISYTLGGLALFFLGRALQVKHFQPATFVTGLLFLFAALVRVSVGFENVTNESLQVVALFFAAGGVLSLGNTVHWWMGGRVA